MADGSIDPASLEGDVLSRWYQRSPADIERERQAAAARRYKDFFYGTSGVDPDPGFDQEVPASDKDVGPGFAMALPSSQDVDPEFTWVPAGPNRWRSVRIANDFQAPGSASPELPASPVLS